ncbi:MAG: GNAT family N-acetyltransferase [Dehalococcoidales bacterium]|nr:GNAT family N-acetyltransferase [Dehalococcoidales bacterium]
MSSSADKIKIRPLGLEDLRAIFLIDKEIRLAGKAVTYANVATEDIFTIDRKVNHHKRPVSYIVGLLEFGFVAEIDDIVCGFILGEVIHIGEDAVAVGSVLILGVHPDYRRVGIATELINALCKKYQSKGIKLVRTVIDQRDQELLGFAEHLGFVVDHRVFYSKKL